MKALQCFVASGFIIFAMILAPIRVIFEFFYIYHPDLFRSSNNMEKHKLKVRKIQEQIRKWSDGGRKGLLCSSRPNWQQFTIRNFNKREMNQIDVNLEDIVNIDTKNQILTVEPRMKMGTLTHKLLAQGWTIPVVPELEELTVGGLICGGGLETSSHKYGCFVKTCVSIEIVVSSGDCLNCSQDENSDLFESIPMSYGTLGFVTSVQIKLIPAKKYVELKYYGTDTYESAKELLESSKHEFVEGLQYGPNKFVIIHGNFVDKAPFRKIKRFGAFYTQLFHWDTERYLTKPPGEVQYVPTRDYYHRHQKAYFWTFTAMWPFFKYGFYRILFGWALPINFTITKWLEKTISRSKRNSALEWGFTLLNFFLQDYLVPIDNLGEFLKIIHEEVEVYPIWLCPIRTFPTKGLIQPRNNEETLYVDIGIYGMSPKKFKNGERLELWKRFEKYTLDKAGCIGFYTDSYLTREEFSQMFPDKLYMEMREKYNCNGAFPLVYDKISVETRNPKLYAEFMKLNNKPNPPV